MTAILYGCMAIAIGCLVWALMPLFNTASSQLTDVLQPLAALPRVSLRRRNPLLGVLRHIGKVVPRSAKDEAFKASRIYPSSELTFEEFRGVKVLCTATGIVLFLVLAREFPLPAMWLPVSALVGFIAPEIWLKGKHKKRDRAILRLLPEVIDLLSLCVGAGVDFLGALNRVVTVREYKNEPLIDELSMAIQEMKLGKRKSEALRAMAKRVNLMELSSFVRALVQADRMGTPIADVLAVHAEDVRIQRFNRAERLALQAPMKLLVPLIFCIMPCVAIIVAAPIFIQFSRSNPFQQLTGEGGQAVQNPGRAVQQ